MLHIPPNRQVWHKAFFLVGSGRRVVAHTHPAWLKMPTASSAFPLLGVPHTPGNKPNPAEGGKSLGGQPPDEISSCLNMLSQIYAAASTAGQSVTQQVEKCSVITAAAVFVDRPTQRASMAQGLFYGGSGRRAVAHTRPAFPKMPMTPSAFPWLGAPQAPGNEPNLPEGSKSLGRRPPGAEGNYPAAKTHSARSVPAASTASRNATQQLEKHSVITAAACSTSLVLD